VVDKVYETRTVIEVEEERCKILLLVGSIEGCQGSASRGGGDWGSVGYHIVLVGHGIIWVSLQGYARLLKEEERIVIHAKGGASCE